MINTEHILETVSDDPKNKQELTILIVRVEDVPKRNVCSAACGKGRSELLLSKQKKVDLARLTVSECAAERS